MRLPWSRPKPMMTPTPTDWIETHAWLSWEAPRNYVAGEASYGRALVALTGAPCSDGYCRPVLVRCEREPNNRFDSNAIRVLVEGRLVGRPRRHLAANLSPRLDRLGCSAFVVPGLLRGGSTRAPNVGCHVWLGRVLEPQGLALPMLQHDPEYEVPWPVSPWER